MIGNYFFFSCDWRKKGQFCETQDAWSLCAAPATHTDKANVGAEPVAVSHLDRGPPYKFSLDGFVPPVYIPHLKKRQRQCRLCFFLRDNC